MTTTEALDLAIKQLLNVKQEDPTWEETQDALEVLFGLRQAVGLITQEGTS